jgi:regulatory protein SWI6
MTSEAVQKIVDALDNEYGSQLTTKENELLALQADLDTVTHQLERTRRSLEQRQSQSQKLSEAQQRTHNIEQALQNGWDQLQSLMQRANKPLPHPQDIDQFDTDQDIDALFDAPPLHYTQDATEEEKKHELENYIKNVQAKVKAYRANDEVLVCEIERLQKKFTDKELQCKRLIAACCNLPMDKIDDLVEPLTLAIESDPPDLDLARVIGFMDKIRRQGAFAVAASSTENSSTVTAAMPASHHQYQYANTSSLRSPQPESTANNNDTVETSSIQ